MARKSQRMIGTVVLLPSKVYRAFREQARANRRPVGQVLRESVAQFQKDVNSAARRKKKRKR